MDLTLIVGNNHKKSPIIGRFNVKNLTIIGKSHDKSTIIGKLHVKVLAKAM